MENLFLGVGLVFNLLGTIILAIPFLKYKIKISERNNEEDLLEGGNNKVGEFWYTQKGLLKNRNIAIYGLGFIFFGFLLQLLSTFL